MTRKFMVYGSISVDFGGNQLEFWEWLNWNQVVVVGYL